LKTENFDMNLPFEEKYLAGKQSGPRKPRILVVPLDWGLGHATRCIPVIYELLNNNCDVFLAGEGAQKALLEQEFPGLPFLPLQGYRVKYGRSGAAMFWNIFAQSRKILKAIRQENKWLKEMVTAHDLDAIISDNRYGLYHPDIPCIFMTHQLTIKSPWKWTEGLLQKRNYRYINRFRECWIPDTSGENNLAGELSHPLQMPAIPCKYIGPLSRFDDITTSQIEPGNLLVILSGPEPQRTILENKIVNDIAHYAGTATVVRGLPAANRLIPSTNTIKFYNHLPAKELITEINRAEYVISRSGYSTVMDVIALQKKSILIPTPGQTEQEYLGHYLHEKSIALSISQNSFSLTFALQSAKIFSYTIPPIKKENKLQQFITQFVLALQEH
jgi:uncharacterized protein (TIGR00661 family)